MVLPGGAATWTVLGPDLRVAGPAEEFLEYLRVQGTSPNTVKSYARALALWWTYLAVFGLAWDALTLADVGGFLAWLRSGDGPQVVTIGPRPARFAESTISTRLRAVTSCYRFHELNGVALGGDLVRVVRGGRAGVNLASAALEFLRRHSQARPLGLSPYPRAAALLAAVGQASGETDQSGTGTSACPVTAARPAAYGSTRSRCHRERPHPHRTAPLHTER